jgi:pimeloyl-ACP methyl ester carboxylesterase
LSIKGNVHLYGLVRLWRHGFITLAAFVISGCTIAPRTENPVPTIVPAADDRKNKTLIIMLPGRGDRAISFRTAGFLAPIEGSDFDVIAVDAHFGYYKERSLVSRLHEDVVVPAKENGYENIWLLGISMGGMGALLYAEQHPDIVDGVILLAPYLGDPGLAREIEDAGGLASWSAEESSFMDHEVAVWDWLKNSRIEQDPVPVYLGYGNSDRFAGNYGALKGKVEGLRIYTEDGGHRWTTWFELWSRISADVIDR